MHIRALHRTSVPDVQSGSRKGQGSGDIIADAYWIKESVKEFQSEVSMCFINYRRIFDWTENGEMYWLQVGKIVGCILSFIYSTYMLRIMYNIMNTY